MNTFNTTGSKRHWVASWLQELGRRTVLPAEPRRRGMALPAFIDELACDIASCDAPERELPGLLVPLNHWLAQQPDTASLVISGLLWPQPESQHWQAISLHTRAPEDLLSQLAALLPDPAPEFGLQWSCEFFEHMLLPLPIGQQQAWLVVSSHQQDQDAEQVRAQLRPVLRPLTRGLCGLHRHQLSSHQRLQEERRFQAAELHDGVAQVLGYVRLQSARLAGNCRDGRHDNLASELEDLSHQCQYAYRQTRELISSGHMSLPGHGLAEGVQLAIEEFEQRSSVIFELDNRLGQLQLDSTTLHQILFVVREALCNLVRHSHATHGRVSLQQRDGQLTITVEDNGRGIQISGDRHGSFGLRIMQERAQRIGAQLEIRNRRPAGTRLFLSVDIGRTHRG
ncbi:sensor histidine kinase [Parathalassolituus penaei]|uniref:histidine kinase n=1 Tax=Parathalassolituus penaei TaxID=2997323 RepID=A0A9X3EJV7_9GAMM|nr:ATP-binding protein [Parathalassolituus penaei]MCY0963928.1 ATP-binding protein [Parathalassolituus penaei]